MNELMMGSKRYSNSPEKSYIGYLFCFYHFSVSILVFEIEWGGKNKKTSANQVIGARDGELSVKLVGVR